MGHSSKFVFPLPGRRSKPAPPPPAAAPLTKAQKILGTADLSLDARPALGWEAQSNSGISIAVTETTNGEYGNGTTRDEWAASKPLRDRRWEQESEIIPAALNRQSERLGSLVPDAATDASSLRRRQSSSTITSYYDKAKLPLSISQQTSNSAMAKGLPAKAMALLDMEGEFTEPVQPKKARKKPSKLDLSALLRGHRSPKHLHPDSSKGHLGRDTLTKSPSATSVSTATTPPPIQQRADRGIGRKITRESLRENPTHQASPYDQPDEEQPTKASLDLHHLYDHYEQRTFADAMDQEMQGCGYRLEPPTPTTAHSGKTSLAPFPSTPLRPAQASKPSPLTAAELRLAGVGIPSNPVAADCASVSSRHTRTSKASKRTDRSLQEIDLLQNSVLALSSDSEDDYELSSKGSLAVPALSDGQASPTSQRSSVSLTSAGAYDGNRGKPVKRTSFAPSPQVFPGSHAAQAPRAPKIAPRTSSLNSKTSSRSGHGLAHETSRLSIGTTSTNRTLPLLRIPDSATATKTVKKMRSDSQFDFPAPPSSRGSRSASVSRSEQSYPVSPTSVDLYLQSNRSPVAPDNGSIRSGMSLGGASLGGLSLGGISLGGLSLGSAANSGRRDSVTSSIHDSNSGRFMAVTRQEEMLLAALRMKRARMREDIIAEFEDTERDEHHELRRETTNDSMVNAGNMSRQSSRSTIRLDTAAALSARPRPPPEVKAPEKPAKGDLLRIVIDRSSFDPCLFEESRSPQSPGGLERKDSRASSTSSQRSGPARQRASLSAMTAPTPRRSQRRDGSSSRRNSGQLSPKVQKDLPHQILEDPAEDDDAGIPRPDSPISPCDFPMPVSITNNKAVRLSAVGFYKPNEAGW